MKNGDGKVYSSKIADYSLTFNNNSENKAESLGDLSIMHSLLMTLSYIKESWNEATKKELQTSVIKNKINQVSKVFFALFLNKNLKKKKKLIWFNTKL